MTESVFVVINDEGEVRSISGYRYVNIEELSLHDLVADFAYDDPENARHDVEYVEGYEKYAPGEEYNNIATGREERMGKRAKENFRAKEIEIEYTINT